MTEELYNSFKKRQLFFIQTAIPVGWVERNSKNNSQCSKSSHLQNRGIYTQEHSETQLQTRKVSATVLKIGIIIPDSV